MTNLVLGRAATASSFVLPYAPSKAINGSVLPLSRWECKVPGYMSVDMGAIYWINRWVVRHMATAGFRAPDYVMNTYKLQGSMDNTNWYDIDAVANNIVAITDRTFDAVSFRFVRLYISKGLNNNNQLGNCMELEVYSAPPSSQYLSVLAISQGTLSPTFAQTTLNYAATVGYDVSSITVTPTSINGGTIKVNGLAVVSGAASTPISLNVGVNTIPVVVTSKIGGVVANYSIVVTRGSSPYLNSLSLSSGTLTPTFSKTTLTGYSASVMDSAIKITPTAEDSGASITVNGKAVVSGQQSSDITLNMGNNPITVIVTAVIGGETKTYSLNVTRVPNLYLQKVNLAYTGRGYSSNSSVTMNYSDLNYGNATSASASQVVVTPFAEDGAVTINVNGQTVSSGSASTGITLSGTTTQISIKVSYAGVSGSRDYVLTITES